MTADRLSALLDAHTRAAVMHAANIVPIERKSAARAAVVAEVRRLETVARYEGAAPHRRMLKQMREDEETACDMISLDPPEGCDCMGCCLRHERECGASKRVDCGGDGCDACAACDLENFEQWATACGATRTEDGFVMSGDE